MFTLVDWFFSRVCSDVFDSRSLSAFSAICLWDDKTWIVIKPVWCPILLLFGSWRISNHRTKVVWSKLWSKSVPTISTIFPLHQLLKNIGFSYIIIMANGSRDKVPCSTTYKVWLNENVVIRIPSSLHILRLDARHGDGDAARAERQVHAARRRAHAQARQAAPRRARHAAHQRLQHRGEEAAHQTRLLLTLAQAPPRWRCVKSTDQTARI